MQRALEAEGFAYYVAQLKRGSTDAYLAYRVYERWWRVAREERAAGLVRRATIRLIEHDPWFLATAMPAFLESLRTEDLERLTPFVGAGPAREAAAMLRAILWYHARRGPYHADREGRAQLRRALGFLERVPTVQRDRAWHEMRLGCYRVLDYERYKRAFPVLLTHTPPAWQAPALHGFLEFVASRKDWQTYDRHRGRWELLPPDHHACQCYLNGLHTDDGLRAAAARRWDAIPDALARAADVRGCAHLNTGGLRLDLVRLLIGKRKHLDAARAYLSRAAGFRARSKDIAALRRRLGAA